MLITHYVLHVSLLHIIFYFVTGAVAGIADHPLQTIIHKSDLKPSPLSNPVLSSSSTANDSFSIAAKRVQLGSVVSGGIRTTSGLMSGIILNNCIMATVGESAAVIFRIDTVFIILVIWLYVW